MSVQFGRWNFDAQPPSMDYIEKVSAVLASYGPDSDEGYANGGVKILYRAFHTTKESHYEIQPHMCPSGALITWDGRLDNRAELIGELRCALAISATDVAIVAAAYEEWGTNFLAKLIGDWALSIWHPIHRSLILAKDPIGIRHLYYSVDDNKVTWSTVLDPLVLFADRTFKICEEYIAGWLAGFPAAHLTPYVGIHAVPPSSSVLVRPGKHIVSKYWDFNPRKRIRYRTDTEYEEHFCGVFATAVRRRLRSDRPVLAELSGGMDSSSIVCMADMVIARGEAGIPRVDTISYFDDSNPNLDERPFVTIVEQKRGRTGYHIDLCAPRTGEKSEADSPRPMLSWFDSSQFAATLEPTRNFRHTLMEHYGPYIRSQGYRVTLSGVAGENPTGGFVPTPTPELQDLLARARFFTLARQLNAWARKMGKSRLVLLWEAVRGFFIHSLTRPGAPKDMSPANWFHPSFVRRNRDAFYWYPSRVNLFGALPSFQHQMQQLSFERRSISDRQLWSELLREIRFPYLDRDLLEFSYAIPHEQIVGVGKRRFLMKRALIGIVPDELLNRKRRTAAVEELSKDVLNPWPRPAEIGQEIISSSVGFVDQKLFVQALQEVGRNEELPAGSLKRTLFLESWLRHLAIQGVLATSSSSTPRAGYSSLQAKGLPI
jgi:asparagine synthase (glutamine-hydrolysing)